jgi:hypothetical protein
MHLLFVTDFPGVHMFYSLLLHMSYLYLINPLNRW